jgi:carboxyl-terminal processing protease
VRIPGFTPATADGVRRAIEEANRRSIDKLIVDVRGTIGGDPVDVPPVASLFTGRGPVARIVTRKVTIKPLDASGEAAWKGRTVLLIDEATGGPAEIFAAALKDRGNATTVGETTVGMAIIQRLVPTGSGGSLYMTVGRYQSPSGTILGGRGSRRTSA